MGKIEVATKVTNGVEWVNETISYRLIKNEIIPSDIEMIIFEFFGLYKSPSQNENYFVDILPKALSKQTCQYENFMLIGDFKSTVKVACVVDIKLFFMVWFCHNLIILIK